MLQERQFLMDKGVEVIDFAMQDPRSLPSRYSEYFVKNQSYKDERSGLFEKLSLGLKLIHSPEAVRQIGRLIDATRPNLVHCHNIYHQLTPSIIGAAKKRGVPVALTLHDYKPICPVYTRLQSGQVCSRCQGGDFRNVLKYRCADGSVAQSAVLFAEAWFQRFLGSYEQVDLVVAPSEFMKGSVAGYRFPEHRVKVIYNGVDTADIRPGGEDRGYALYLGRLSAEKGLKTLLAAHTQCPGACRLVVAGTGPLEDELRASCPGAEFVGHVTGSELEETVRGASVIVVPSEWYENCPMSVLEAMSYGKPVVASRIGGIPELVVHGETGLLYPAGDRDALAGCLKTLMGDPALRRSFGVAARKRVEERYSLERHNAELWASYQGLVGGHGLNKEAVPVSAGEMAAPR